MLSGHSLASSEPVAKQNFEGFAKFKCKHKEAKALKKAVEEALPDSFVFSDKKPGNKKTYFILTDEHADRFVDFIGSINFFDLKQNIEKFLNEKARKINIDDLKKALENGTLSV